MLSKKSLHRIESLHCVRKQSTIIHRNEEDYVNVHNVVISKDCSILFSFFQQCIVCLYFVLKIAETTNMSTKNHKILAIPCMVIEKPVYLHIFCNQNRNNCEYGNKNTANIRG